MYSIKSSNLMCGQGFSCAQRATGLLAEWGRLTVHVAQTHLQSSSGSSLVPEKETLKQMMRSSNTGITAYDTMRPVRQVQNYPRLR